MRSRAHAEPMSKLAIAELVSEWVQLRHAALQSAEMRGGWESHRGGREQEVFILFAGSWPEDVLPFSPDGRRAFIRVINFGEERHGCIEPGPGNAGLGQRARLLPLRSLRPLREAGQIAIRRLRKRHEIEAALAAPNQHLIVTWTTGAFANLAVNLALSVRQNVQQPKFDPNRVARTT